MGTKAQFTRLELLRKAVAAKVAYWKANGALEKALCGNDERKIDRNADRIEEYIENCAVGIDSALDVSCIKIADVVDLTKELLP